MKRLSILAVVFMMAFMVLPRSLVFAAEKMEPKKTQTISNETVKVHGESMQIKVQKKVIGNKEYSVSEVKSKAGTLIFTYSKDDGSIKVTSSNVSKGELKTIQNNANQTINDNQSVIKKNNSAIAPLAASQWHVGKWSKYKVTANGKFTAQTIIGVLGAAFNLPGVAFAAIANIAIQYLVKTGYYKVRNDVRLLNANYIQNRTYTKLYKDKKYIKQVGKTQKTYTKVWAGI